MMNRATNTDDLMDSTTTDLKDHDPNHERTQQPNHDPKQQPTLDATEQPNHDPTQQPTNDTTEQSTRKPETQEHNPDDDDDEDEDEDGEICRICRCGAEEDRPLFHPCVCAGSIRYVHQECLIQWLEHNNSSTMKCELCGHHFGFTPMYSVDAPETLPYSQVAVLFVKRVVRYFPFVLRLVLVVFCWLFQVPFITCVLFRILTLNSWGNRGFPVSEWDLILGCFQLSWEDAIESWSTGACVNVGIMVSFLALLSVVDFVRFHNDDDLELMEDQWLDNHPQAMGGEPGHELDGEFVHQPEHGQMEVGFDDYPDARDEEDRHAYDEEDRHAYDEEDRHAYDEEDRHAYDEEDRHAYDRDHLHPFDDDYQHIFDDEHEDLRQFGRRIAQPNQGTERNLPHQPFANPPQPGDRNIHVMRDLADSSHARMVRMDEERMHDIGVDDHYADETLRFVGNLDDVGFREDEEGFVEEEVVLVGQQPVERDGHGAGAGFDGAGAQINGDEENMGNANMMDMDMDVGEGMDINIALDELIGLRGPLFVLLHNIMWLLTFDVLYLCVSLFVPTTLGAVVLKTINRLSVKGFGHHLLSALDVKFLMRQKHSVPASETMPEFLDLSTHFLHLANQLPLNQCADLNPLTNLPNGPGVHADLQTAELFGTCTVYDAFYLKYRFSVLEISAVALGYICEAAIFYVVFVVARLMHAAILREEALALEEEDDAHHFLGRQDENVVKLVVRNGAQFLEIVNKVMKVVLLLALKMGVIPISLGVLLERCSRSLFMFTLDQRYVFAMHHPLLTMLVFWVAGISHMLVITVIVLQLREVLHPDLLHGIIRPHDPNINLLRTLLVEPLTKHFRRMLVSCAIYMMLIVVFVDLPIRLVQLALPGLLPMAFNLKSLFVEIQLPLELAAFHISVLHLLDNSKALISSVQESWLEFMCEKVGMTRYLMPIKVNSEAGRIILAQEGVREDQGGEIATDAAPGAPSEKNSEDLGTSRAVGDVHEPNCADVERSSGVDAVQEPSGMFAHQNDEVHGERVQHDHAQGEHAQHDHAQGEHAQHDHVQDEHSTEQDLEDELLPRVAPRLVGFRALTLVFAAWLSSLAVMAVVLVVPAVVGYVVRSVLSLPWVYCNDIHQYMLGCLVIWRLYTYASEVDMQVVHNMFELFAREGGGANVYRKVGAGVICVVNLLWVIPLMVGVIMELMLVSRSSDCGAQDIANLTSADFQSMLDMRLGQAWGTNLEEWEFPALLSRCLGSVFWLRCWALGIGVCIVLTNISMTYRHVLGDGVCAHLFACVTETVRTWDLTPLITMVFKPVLTMLFAALVGPLVAVGFIDFSSHMFLGFGLAGYLGIIVLFRALVIVCIALMGMPYMYKSAKAVLKGMHDLLRDEEYMIGKQLHNLEDRTD